MRSDGEAVAVNLPDLEVAENPTGVRWVDPTHEGLPVHGYSHPHDHNHSHDHDHDHSH